MRQNELKTDLNCPRFVPFGAQFGWQIWHPWFDTTWRWYDPLSANLAPMHTAQVTDAAQVYTDIGAEMPGMAQIRLDWYNNLTHWNVGFQKCRRAKMYRQLILKSPRFVQFCVNLFHSRSKLTTLGGFRRWNRSTFDVTKPASRNSSCFHYRSILL